MVWFIDGITQGEGRAETADFHQLQAVRAYWEAMRKPGHLPRRDDINPRGIASALEQVFLVEQIAPHHGRLRLAGMALSDLLGMDPRGMPVTALLEPVARATLSEALGGLFRGEHLLDLWLEAERGIGRPPPMGADAVAAAYRGLWRAGSGARVPVYQGPDWPRTAPFCHQPYPARAVDGDRAARHGRCFCRRTSSLSAAKWAA